MNSYLQDVLTHFVNDMSGHLGVDLSWTLESRTAKLAEATRQYSEEMEGVLVRRDGKPNQNPHRHGNAFEVRDSFLRNVDEALDDGETRYATTDHLYNRARAGDELPASVRDVAKYNDDATDVVGIRNGRVIKSERAQYKSVKDFSQLGKARYIESNAEIIVPPEDLAKARRYWERQRKKGNKNAEQVLIRLRAGKASKASVSQKDTVLGDAAAAIGGEKARQDTADTLLKAEATLASAAGSATHVTVQHAHHSLRHAVSYLVGRCIVELRDYWAAGAGGASLPDRFHAVLDDTRARFSDVFSDGIVRHAIKAAVNYAVNALVSTLANIKNALKKGGEYFRTLCREVFDFVTGRSPSLVHTLSAITKGVAAISVVALAAGLQQYLESIGVPPLLAYAMAAFASALMTVAIFRLVDHAVSVVLGIVMARDVALLRYEEIEEIFSAAMPAIELGMLKVERLVREDRAQRDRVFTMSYSEIRKSVDLEDVALVAAAYQDLYRYIGKEIPFRSETELDLLMQDKDSYRF